jgi:hypothetical protein
MILFWLIIFILACFSFVLVFGPPYVPTLISVRRDALDLLDLKKGQLLIELGSGDGRLLVEAARKGIKSVGYELNPIMYLISVFVTRRYRQLICVRYGNFWAKQWPPADGIYAFLLPKYMARLDKKIIHSKGKHTRLVTYAFRIPDKIALAEKGALCLYEY